MTESAKLTEGPLSQSIEEKLKAGFDPVHLEVRNESYMHNVPEGSESHFRVVVVSELFRDQSRVARHRKVNETLKDELQGGVHALAIETYLPEDWDSRQQKAQISPPCLGGSK